GIDDPAIEGDEEDDVLRLLEEPPVARQRGRGRLVLTGTRCVSPPVGRIDPIDVLVGTVPVGHPAIVGRPPRAVRRGGSSGGCAQELSAAGDALPVSTGWRRRGGWTPPGRVSAWTMARARPCWRRR